MSKGAAGGAGTKRKGGVTGAPAAKKKKPDANSDADEAAASSSSSSSRSSSSSSSSSSGDDAHDARFAEALAAERAVYLEFLKALKERMLKSPNKFFSDLAELRVLHTAGKTPILCARARQILPLQPTQTSSERIFSRSAAVTKDRFSQKTTLIEDLVLSSKNCRAVTNLNPGVNGLPESVGSDADAELADTASDHDVALDSDEDIGAYLGAE